MNFPPLASFNLVGGTALALQFGHRISVDLDFFTEETFDVVALKQALTATFNEENIVRQLEKEYSLLLNINDIKVDILYYPYPLIDDLIIEDTIRILSPKDIAPMKLSAIAQRGAKKDFFDMYELLKNSSLDEMLQYYQEKFPNTDTTFLLRSLLYFDDAEVQDDPIMLKPYTWKEVKKEITKQVNAFIERQMRA
jgi:predicted nucleotidyltransferase component of viral defense system